MPRNQVCTNNAPPCHTLSYPARQRVGFLGVMIVKDLKAAIEHMDDYTVVVTQSYPSKAWANVESVEVTDTAVALLTEDDHPQPS